MCNWWIVMLYLWIAMFLVDSAMLLWDMICFVFRCAVHAMESHVSVSLQDVSDRNILILLSITDVRMQGDIAFWWCCRLMSVMLWSSYAVWLLCSRAWWMSCYWLITVQAMICGGSARGWIKAGGGNGFLMLSWCDRVSCVDSGWCKSIG